MPELKKYKNYLDPLIVSHGWNKKNKSINQKGALGNSRFIDMFEYNGTKDPAAWLSVPASIRYINNLKNLILEFEENYTLNRKDNLIEGIMLNLRLSSGINHEQFEKKFNFDFNDKFFQTINKLLEYDLIKTNNKKTILTEKGKLLSDSIFVLFQEEINSNPE